MSDGCPTCWFPEVLLRRLRDARRAARAARATSAAAGAVGSALSGISDAMSTMSGLTDAGGGGGGGGALTSAASIAAAAAVVADARAVRDGEDRDARRLARVISHTPLISERAIELQRKTIRYIDVYIKTIAGGEVTHVTVEDAAPITYLYFLYRANSSTAGIAPRSYLFLPVTTGAFEVGEEVIDPTPYDAGSSRGHMTLADYRVTGNAVALFNLAHKRPQAAAEVITNFVNSNFQWRDADGRATQLSLAVQSDMYAIPAPLPSADAIQSRLIPLLAKYMGWHKQAEGLELARRAEEKARAVQDFLERKRLMRIAAHRLKRDAPG